LQVTAATVIDVTDTGCTESSLKSFNYHTGIMLLEKQLLTATAPAAERAVKKRKSNYDDKSTVWSQLARLYRALGEEDVLRGIFDKEIAKHDYTKVHTLYSLQLACELTAALQQALEAELRGDYVEALNIYEKATKHLDEGLPWAGAAPSAQEVCTHLYLYLL
jgi:tetratricopeptide (TPR) repeat protein